MDDLTADLARRLVADQFPAWAHLPVTGVEPVAVGAPTDAYPHPWSIRRWLEGDTLDTYTTRPRA